MYNLSTKSGFVQSLIIIALGALCGAIGVRADQRFTHPQLQTFGAEYEQRQEALQMRQAQALVDWAQAKHDEMDEAVRRATLSRNAREIMMARESRGVWEAVLENLRAGKPVEWPERIRADLRPLIEEWQQGLEEQRARQEQERREFEERSHQAFARLWARVSGETVAPDRAAELFAHFVGFTPAAAVELPDVPIERKPVEVVEEKPEEESPYFAESRSYPPDIPWAVVGRWTGDMRGMDIVRIDIFELTTPRRWRQLNVRSGREAELAYFPLANLPKRSDYVFRMSHLDDRDEVNVMEWPSSQNHWQLVVRTRPESGSPHPTGFLLEAALREVDLPGALEYSGRLLEDVKEPVVAGSGTAINLPITSVPDIASILINGQPYLGPRGPVATPYTVTLPPGRHEVRLTYRFFEDFVTNLVAQAGQSLHVVMQPRKDLPWQETTFTPGRSWERSRITVRPGDFFFLESDGEWQIGARREFTTANGYNPKDFPHYYEGRDLRIVHRANYGALLIRFGYEANTNYFGQAPYWRAPTDRTVEVWLNVNELEDPALRRDNRGRITIRSAIVNRSTFTD